MITFACLHLTRFNHEMNVSEGSKYHGTKSRMATWWLLLLFRAMELTNSNHMTAHIGVGGGQTAPFSGGACENAQMHQEEFIVFHSQARNVPKCLKCTQSKVKARISVGCVGDQKNFGNGFRAVRRLFSKRIWGCRAQWRHLAANTFLMFSKKN